MDPSLPGAPLECRSLREAVSASVGVLGGLGFLGLPNVAEDEPALREAAPVVPDTLASCPDGIKVPAALREAALTVLLTTGGPTSSSSSSLASTDHVLDTFNGFEANVRLPRYLRCSSVPACCACGWASHP